jgi:hypothetical protein
MRETLPAEVEQAQAIINKMYEEFRICYFDETNIKASDAPAATLAPLGVDANVGGEQRGTSFSVLTNLKWCVHLSPRSESPCLPECTCSLRACLIHFRMRLVCAAMPPATARWRPCW